MPPPNAKRRPAEQRTDAQNHPDKDDRSPASVDLGASATRFRPGDRVCCERATPARGSWSRFAGRTGTVVTINRQRSVDGTPDVVEYGVSFDNTHNIAGWFLPPELVIAATSGRLLDANGEVGRWTVDDDNLGGTR